MDLGGMIYIMSFTKISLGIQVILWIITSMASRCHDIHTRFHKDWFRHSTLVKGKNIYRWQGDLIRLFYFCKGRHKLSGLSP